MPTVIAPQHHDRVFRQPQFVQRTGDLANLCIHVCCARVVTVDQLASQFVLDLPTRRHRLEGGNFSTTLEGNPRRVLGKRIVHRQWQLGRIVHVPIFFRRRKWQVWPNKTGCDEKRCAILRTTRLRRLQPNDGFIRHAAVGVILVICNWLLERGAPGKRTNLPQLLVCEQRLLASEFAAVRALRHKVLDYLVVKMRHLERLRITQVPVADVEHLAKRLSAVTEP